MAKVNHTHLAGLTKAFVADGIAGTKDYAAKHLPDVSHADIEKKLRSVGVLAVSSDDKHTIAAFVESVRDATHPWLVAEEAIASLKTIVAEHEAEIGVAKAK